MFPDEPESVEHGAKWPFQTKEWTNKWTDIASRRLVKYQLD